MSFHAYHSSRTRACTLNPACPSISHLTISQNGGCSVGVGSLSGALPSMAAPSAPSAPAAPFAPAAPSFRSSLPPPAASAQTIKQEYNQAVPLTGTTPVLPASMLGQSAASSWQGEGSGASSATKAESSNLGTKVLIHALLCPKVRSAAPARDDFNARPPARARALARTHGGTISHTL